MINPPLCRFPACLHDMPPAARQEIAAAASAQLQALGIGQRGPAPCPCLARVPAARQNIGQLTDIAKRAKDAKP